MKRVDTLATFMIIEKVNNWVETKDDSHHSQNTDE